MSIRGRIIVAAVAGAWLGAVPVTWPDGASGGCAGGAGGGGRVDRRYGARPSIRPVQRRCRRAGPWRPGRRGWRAVRRRRRRRHSRRCSAWMRPSMTSARSGTPTRSTHTFEMVNTGRRAVTIPTCTAPAAARRRTSGKSRWPPARRGSCRSSSCPRAGGARRASRSPWIRTIRGRGRWCSCWKARSARGSK